METKVLGAVEWEPGYRYRVVVADEIIDPETGICHIIERQIVNGLGDPVWVPVMDLAEEMEAVKVVGILSIAMAGYVFADAEDKAPAFDPDAVEAG